jgi:methyl-accepting chemotaxis protein
MNTFVSSLVHLMSRFSLIKRFITITLMVTLALVWFVFSSISENYGLKKTTQQELQGMYLVLPVIGILDSLQDLRSLSIKQQFNPASVNASSIDDLVNKIDAHYAQMGDLVNKTDTFNIHSDFESLVNNWQQVKAKRNDPDKDKFHLYDEYIDEPKEFLKNLAALSQLNLEVENDNYYLIQMVAIQFPELLEAYQMQKDLMIKSLYKKQLDPDTINFMGQSIAITKQNISYILNEAQYITNDNKVIKADISQMIKSIKGFDVQGFYDAHVANSKFDAKPEALEEGMTVIIDLGIDLFSKMSQILVNNLVQRDLNIRNSLFMEALFCFAVILLLTLFFVILYKSTKRSLEYAADAAHQIAEGDLASGIYSDCKDDFQILFDAFSKMQEKLLSIVGEINEVSSTVNNSAREISTGNANLSERTQEQASGLVETAASLNNLTETVKKNADSAREATSLADKSSHIAEQGKDAVAKVLVTMGEINDSAEKIQEITSVIDGIAFQTNLLALNASVEAARAGEQGRGFAVVASEVRNLAQRSSDAAKQIKELINDSMSKVEAGDKQVKMTAETMQGILESINQVNDIVKLISIASAEQSSGIEQINIVVAGMEEGTQKNAALVEEAAASAELLEKQSDRMVEVMEHFKTN